MFKLPSESDYFTRNTLVLIPDKKGGYLKGKVIVKFKYMPQSWLRGIQEKLKDEDAILNASEEEQVDILREVMYGFDGIAVDDRELDENDSNDVEWVIETGPYSLYFRMAFLREFYASINDARGKLSRTGN